MTELKASSTFYFQTVENRLSSMKLIRMDLNRKLDMRAKRMPTEDTAPTDRMITTVILLVDQVKTSRIIQNLMEAVVTVVIQMITLARENSVDL